MNLPDVTLCVIDDNPALAVRALDKSMEHIAFGDVILFTDSEHPYSLYKGIRVIPIDHRLTNWHDNFYCEFILRRLAQHITTSHILKVEWDGYVVNPNQWSDDFLRYDYIGAPWAFHLDHRNVGNGGFSLRSRRLLELTASLTYKKPVDLDDVFICRTARDWLENYHDIKFAPDHIAKRFAHERSPPENSFGFHGLYNFWRYHTDAEIIALVNSMPNCLLRKPEFNELIEVYRLQQNNDVYHALDKRRAAAQ